MTPPVALIIPPENEQTTEVVTFVINELNDIDRAMYPPVETLHERHEAIIALYKAVGERYADMAEVVGVSDWLQSIILNRILPLLHDDECLDRPRAIFAKLERLGYTSVTLLIYERMIWASRLAERGAAEEAKQVAQLLLDDLPSLRAHYSHFLPSELDEEVEQFRARIGV